MFLSAFLVQHGHVGGIRQLFFRQAKHVRIDFDGDHRRRDPRHLRRERTGPRADFQHHILRLQLGRVHQHLEQVQVDEEVLPIARDGLDPHFLEAVTQKSQSLARRHNSFSREAATTCSRRRRPAVIRGQESRSREARQQVDT